MLRKMLLASDTEDSAFICLLPSQLDTIGLHTKWRQQKSVKLFIVIFPIVNLRRDTPSNLHQRVSVWCKYKGHIMLKSC